MSRLLRAGLLTAVTDGLFSSVLVVAAYGSTVTRLWQGVAAVLLGPSAFEGGSRTVLIGLAMHVGVAFAWAALFFLLVERAAWLRRLLASPLGVVRVAVVYGPLVWSVMSFVVIPAMTGRWPPTINLRWWVQFFGHFPFVGLPIVAGIGLPREGERERG